MARPEKPLEGTGPVIMIAKGLRGLRVQAGSPRYSDLALRTGCAASTLSKAASGERLPTLEATLAFVRGCGGDEGEWKQRWRTAKTLLDTGEGAPTPTEPKTHQRAASPAGASRPPARRADPLSATTPAEFVREMRILRIHAGSPSFAALGRRINASGSTIHAALHAQRLPKLWLVRAFAAACGDDPGVWATAWTNLAVEEELRATAPVERPTLRIEEEPPETAPAERPKLRIVDRLRRNVI